MFIDVMEPPSSEYGVQQLSTDFPKVSTMVDEAVQERRLISFEYITEKHKKINK